MYFLKTFSFLTLLLTYEVSFAGTIGELRTLTHEGDASVVSGDFDGDGDIDVVAASSCQYDPMYFRNNGEGKFTKVSEAFGDFLTLWTDCDGGISLSAGDYDGDGDLDISVVTTATHKIKFFKNNGRGIFSDK